MAVAALNLWALVIGGGVILLTFFIAAPEQKVVFLDVGQGDAILLQSGTQQVLIDGGQGAAVLRRLGEELPWFDRTIEVVISTHPDRDHLEGLLHVLERYDVALVLLPRVPHTSDLQAEWLTQLERAVASANVQYHFAHGGQSLQLKDTTIHILGPLPASLAASKTNNASVITKISYHDMSFLLTGDAEAPVERALVRHFGSALDVDVLKAGHHGSKTSTSANLLAAATPATVVISAGKDNRFGHPHPDVLARLEPYRVWRTDEHGSVRFRYANDQWLVSATTR